MSQEELIQEIQELKKLRHPYITQKKLLLKTLKENNRKIKHYDKIILNKIECLEATCRQEGIK